MAQARIYESNAMRQAAYNARVREGRATAERLERERLAYLETRYRIARQNMADVLEADLKAHMDVGDPLAMAEQMRWIYKLRHS